jgi:hypothetical protein
MELGFLNRLSKNTQISNVMKIHPVGVELLHVDGLTDRQADMRKVIVAFRKFANAPKDYCLLFSFHLSLTFPSSLLL